VSPRTTTSEARRLFAASSKRSSARRPPAKRKRTRSSRWTPRRGLVVAITLLVGVGAGLAIARTGTVQRTLLQITLPLHHEDVIRQQAARWDVPPELIAAVIYAESRFRDQTSSAGARGLMQITPATAQIIEQKSHGTTFTPNDLSNPQINISYGTFYLHYLLQRFNGNEVAAIAAYNAGETNVANWGGSSLTADNIPFPETRSYVQAVIAKRDDYRQSYGHELG
jgi:peptidoglycan lytic transglycosylase